MFSLTPPASVGGAWTESVVFDFSITGGASPSGALALTNGTDGQPTLYGTTQSGGILGCATQVGGCGVVFSLAPPPTPSGPWTETVLHAFDGTPHDGGNPYAGVTIGNRGVLYGTTYDGIFGTNSKYDGTNFAIIPPSSPGGRGESLFCTTSAAAMMDWSRSPAWSSALAASSMGPRTPAARAVGAPSIR